MRHVKIETGKFDLPGFVGGDIGVFYLWFQPMKKTPMRAWEGTEDKWRNKEPQYESHKFQ